MKRWLPLLLLTCLGQALASPLTPPDYQRLPAQTWQAAAMAQPALHADDYARHLAAHQHPSHFPWLARAAGLWRSQWLAVRAQLAAPGDLRPGQQTGGLLGTLGLSTAYSLRAAYEQGPGRLAELARGAQPTAEELLAASVARDYAEFIRHRPWYEFDHLRPLLQLWRSTGLSGPDPARKWERKYALSTEYLARAIGAGFMRLFARPAPAAPRTAVVVDRWLDRLDGAWPEMQRLKSYRTGGQLVLLPGQSGFTGIASAIAGSGANFVEIAGNDAAAPILLSVLAPPDWHPPGSVRLRQNLGTSQAAARVYFSIPIGQLAEVLRELDQAGLRAERIYDY